MGITIRKLAPTAVIVALICYCCWPYFEQSGINLGDADEDSRPQITSIMLSPPIPEPPVRNPFLVIGAVKPKPKVVPSKILKPVPKPIPPKPIDDKRRKPEVRVRVDLAKESRRFVLNATLVAGNRRTAIINGEFYSQGDTLNPSEPGADRIVIDRIQATYVLIRAAGQTATIRYPNTPSKPSASQKPPKRNENVQ